MSDNITLQVPLSSSQLTTFIISDDGNFEHNNLLSNSQKQSNYTETKKESKGNTTCIILVIKLVIDISQ